jgi:FkbM family methyltransferase
MSLNKIKNYFEPKSILDIGANTGQFYREISQIFPDAYYFLIEGNDGCEIPLQSIGVDYSIAMLSDCEKLVNYYIRDGEPLCTGNSIYKENSAFYDEDKIIVVQKQTKTLPQILNDKLFDLIKIDVQGSELDIIKGGLDIIKSSKGVLMEVSLVEFNQGAPRKQEVVDFMKDIGFEFVEIIANINHPMFHTLIQEDVLFLNKNI